MNQTTLILPCETQAREFDAKLLLACFAAESGYRVIVGEKKEINRRIAALPRSVYLSKSLTNRNTKLYRLLHRLGHSVVLGDEEGLVYASPQAYRVTKVGAAAMREGDAMLAWGDANAQVWRETPGYTGAPIAVTGNARLDLLRRELRPFFAQQTEALRQRWGDFILVNTNFSRINHYFSGQSRQLALLDGTAAPGGGDAALTGLAAHKKALFDHFLDMLPKLAEAFPQQTIVVRPHPSENQQTWRDAAAGHPHVQVVHEGNVIPWLLAARTLIHNGCTTAVESYVLGNTALAYQPVQDPAFDLYLPNAMSESVTDLQALFAAVDRRLRGEPAPDRSRRDEIARRHMAALDGPFASERIVAACAPLARQLTQRKPALPALIGGQAQARARAMRKELEKLIPGHRNNTRLLRHMFPGVSCAQATAQVARYGQILNRFADLRLRQRYPNVFELSR